MHRAGAEAARQSGGAWGVADCANAGNSRSETFHRGGPRSSMARDQTERAAATHGTVAHRQDHDGDTRGFSFHTRVHIRCDDTRLAAVVQGDLT